MANITFTVGSGVNDSIFGKSQEPIKLFIEKKAEAYEQMSVLPEIYNVESTNQWAAKFTTMTGMDDFQPVTENAAYPVDGMREGFSKVIEHVEWKKKFDISRKMVDDANLVDLKQQPQSFIAAWYRTRERFGARMLGEAIQGHTSFTIGSQTFDTTGADKVCLFSKVHPSAVKASRTQSNCFADAFSNDALMAMESAMQDFRGDNNEVLDVAPNTIVIPNDYALKKAVFAAIGADHDPGTANNGYNYTYGNWTVIIWQYLNQFIASGTKPWLLLDPAYNRDNMGAAWLDRVQLEVKSEIADNDANVWKGYGRFGVGFNDWRFAAVGGVAGGTQLIS